MPPTRTSTRTASSSGKAEGSSSTRDAAAGQKRTRPADEKASSSKTVSPSASKKQRDNAASPVATTKPKSILKKTAAPTKTPKAAASTSKAPSATKAKPAATASAAKAPAKKTSAKSPLTSKKPVAVAQVDEEDSDEEDEGLDSDEEAEMLKGMSSDSDAQDEEEDEANSSDEDDDEADEQAMKRHSKIEVSKLRSSKDDAAVQARLNSVEKKRNASQGKDTPSAVLYVGRLPRHFTEGPLRQYFSQFGTITRLRLSRNKKTGASKHYAFLEFADEEVARIVQETMDGYLILSQILRVKLLEKEKIHPKLWIGANRAFRKVPRARIARAEHDGPKTVEQKQRAERKLLERQDKKKKDLKERGIDYEYEGYKATA